MTEQHRDKLKAAMERNAFLGVTAADIAGFVDREVTWTEEEPPAASTPPALVPWKLDGFNVVSVSAWAEGA